MLQKNWRRRSSNHARAATVVQSSVRRRQAAVEVSRMKEAKHAAQKVTDAVVIVDLRAEIFSRKRAKAKERSIQKLAAVKKAAEDEAVAIKQAAEDEAVAVKQAAEDEAAAVKKVAEDKAAAAQKAAEDEAATAQKAVEDAAAAAKAEEEAAAAKKAAEEEAAAANATEEEAAAVTEFCPVTHGIRRSTSTIAEAVTARHARVGAAVAAGRNRLGGAVTARHVRVHTELAARATTLHSVVKATHQGVADVSLGVMYPRAYHRYNGQQHNQVCASDRHGGSRNIPQKAHIEAHTGWQRVCSQGGLVFESNGRNEKLREAAVDRANRLRAATSTRNLQLQGGVNTRYHSQYRSHVLGYAPPRL